MFRSVFRPWSVLLALVVTAGVASAQGFPDDSFLCYKGKGSEKLAKGTQASLTDQFESGTFDVKKKRGVCNPANVDGAGIFAGTTHLAAYQIKAATKHTKQTNIQVENRFGLITLDTIKEDRILVPAAQSTEESVTPPNDADHNVDRYKCYRAKPTRRSTPNDAVLSTWHSAITRLTRASINAHRTRADVPSAASPRRRCACTMP